MLSVPVLLALLIYMYHVPQLGLHADQQSSGVIHGEDTATLLHWEIARLHGARTDIKNLFSHWA